MIEPRYKDVATRIGALAFLAICVAVLTLVFNLFGALFTSILAGMMTGAQRQWKLQTVYASLVPPIVVLIVGQVTKADVAIRQRLTLAALCFGAFWATNLMTWLMMCLEKKSDASPADAVSQASPSTPQLVGAPECSALQGEATGLVAANGHLSLVQLQGMWHCEANRNNEEKHIAITEDRFALTFVDSSGTHMIEGHVIVEADSRRIGFAVREDKSTLTKVVPNGVASCRSDPTRLT